jgi:carbonic anhydrase
MEAMKEIQRLKKGNEKYLTAKTSIGDISSEIREQTAREGQKPYAVIVTCSDSRVIPESIFSAGIGELFVIRSAGFTIDKNSLGSIEYAVEHLGIKLIVVMGHTHCGAVGTALGHEKVHGNLGGIIGEISQAIGQEKDADKAVELNVRHSCNVIKADGIEVVITGAVYHTDSGIVEFLEEA